MENKSVMSTNIFSETSGPCDEKELNDLIPDWLRQYLNSLPDREREQHLTRYCELIQQLAGQLSQSQVIKPDAQQGQFSIKLGGNTFFNLKEGLKEVVKVGGAVLFASVIGGPLVLGIPIAEGMSWAGIGGAVAGLAQNLSTLNPDEMDTYKAVAIAIDGNKMKVLGPEGATLKQVEDVFVQKKKTLSRPDDVKAIVDILVEKKVLHRETRGGSVEYFVSF
jgi:hypothetical protein